MAPSPNILLLSFMPYKSAPFGTRLLNIPSLPVPYASKAWRGGKLGAILSAHINVSTDVLADIPSALSGYLSFNSDDVNNPNSSLVSYNFCISASACASVYSVASGSLFSRIAVIHNMPVL